MNEQTAGATRPGENAAPVSVVIPCYNCSATIERAVASVVAQVVVPAELIIVNDASKDDSLEVIEKIRDRYSSEWCHVINLPNNMGSANARNAGWDTANQPFIAFLDADDVWHPRKLEIQYAWMNAHPRAVLTGHSSIRKLGNEEWTRLPERWQFRRVPRWRLLLSNRFPTRSVMLRRSIDFRFDPERRYGEDYLLWLQILMAGFEAWRVELPLACSYKPDFGAGGLSAELWRMEQGELETYRYLYQQKRTPFLAFAALTVWSLLRYGRRVLVQSLRINRILK